MEKTDAKQSGTDFGDPWERMSDQENSDDTENACTCHLSHDEPEQENLVGLMLVREREEASPPEVVVHQLPEDLIRSVEESRPLTEQPKPLTELSPLDPDDLPDTHIALAWLVTLCFNIPLGVLAICMSMKAAKMYIEGKRKQGRHYTKLSLYASLAGIVFTVVTVMSVVLYLAVKEAADRRRRHQG